MSTATATPTFTSVPPGGPLLSSQSSATTTGPTTSDVTDGTSSAGSSTVSESEISSIYALTTQQEEASSTGSTSASFYASSPSSSSHGPTSTTSQSTSAVTTSTTSSSATTSSFLTSSSLAETSYSRTSSSTLPSTTASTSTATSPSSTSYSTPTSTAASSTSSQTTSQSTTTPPFSSAPGGYSTTLTSVFVTEINGSAQTTTSIIPTVLPYSPSPSTDTTSRTATIAGSTAGALFALLLLLGGVFWWRRRRREKERKSWLAKGGSGGWSGLVGPGVGAGDRKWGVGRRRDLLEDEDEDDESGVGTGGMRMREGVGPGVDGLQGLGGYYNSISTHTSGTTLIGVPPGLNSSVRSAGEEGRNFIVSHSTDSYNTYSPYNSQAYHDSSPLPSVEGRPELRYDGSFASLPPSLANSRADLLSQQSLHSFLPQSGRSPSYTADSASSPYHVDSSMTPAFHLTQSKNFSRPNHSSHNLHSTTPSGSLFREDVWPPPMSAVHSSSTSGTGPRGSSVYTRSSALEGEGEWGRSASLLPVSASGSPTSLRFPAQLRLVCATDRDSAIDSDREADEAENRAETPGIEFGYAFTDDDRDGNEHGEGSRVGVSRFGTETASSFSIPQGSGQDIAGGGDEADLSIMNADTSAALLRAAELA